LHIKVNGEELEVSLHFSLQALINHLNLAPERIAIELNQNVVRRSDWPATLLEEDDRVEIVHFVGGGNQEADDRRPDGTNLCFHLLPAVCLLVWVSVFSALRCKVPIYLVVRLKP